MPAGAALALSLGLQPAAVRANSFEVTNLDDSGPGSLRAAIVAANSDPHSVITFHSGLSGTIVLTSGQLYIYESMDIVGPGPNVLAVDGNAASRVLYARSADRDVTISGLKITGGGDLGCVFNRNNRLLLDSVSITECAGGAVGTGGSKAGLTVRHSVIANNGGVAIAVADVGFDGGTVLIQDSGSLAITQRRALASTTPTARI